ncbi:MAG: thermonuclease family protein, partial [Gemmatimonadota bacterium]
MEPRARIFGWLILCSVAATPAAGQVSPPEGMDFVASASGEVYYPVWCDAWESLAVQNLRWFRSAAESERAGYRRTRNRQCASAGRDTMSAATSGNCTVERIIDGDTLACRETTANVRLILIDAPELAQGESGRQATRALRELLPPGSAARLEMDVQERDRYGRILAYVYDSEGSMINAELARRGFVIVAVYPPNVRHLELIRAAVEEARRRGRGLWSRGAFQCL